MPQLAVQLLEAAILRRVATFTGDVHRERNLAPEPAEKIGPTVDTRHADVVEPVASACQRGLHPPSTMSKVARVAPESSLAAPRSMRAKSLSRPRPTPRSTPSCSLSGSPGKNIWVTLRS